MAEVDSYLQLWIKCYLTNVQINVYELSTVNYAKCKKIWGYGTNWLAKNFMKIALLVTYSFFLWHETKNLKKGLMCTVSLVVLEFTISVLPWNYIDCK